MIQKFLIEDFHPSSKIWVYTLQPLLNTEIQNSLTIELTEFCKTWTAHNKELRSFYRIFEDRFLILGVDEHLNPASGCSIDKSVHFLEDLEKKYSLNIFERMLFSYFDENNDCITLTKQAFENAIANNQVNLNTKVINTLCTNLNDWNTKSIQYLIDSWMKNFFSVPV